MNAGLKEMHVSIGLISDEMAPHASHEASICDAVYMHGNVCRDTEGQRKLRSEKKRENLVSF